MNDPYCGIADIMIVKQLHFGGMMWIMLVSAGTILNAVLFTVLTQSCSSATCGVRRYINVLLLTTAAFRNDVKKIMKFQSCVFRNTPRSLRDMSDAIFFEYFTNKCICMNEVQGKILGLREKKLQETGRDSMVKSRMIHSVYKILE